MSNDGFHPSTLVFLDTEYTSLNPQFRHVWNIGMIRRWPDGHEVAEEIILSDPDLTYADPMSLEIGHFWRRHPEFGGNPGSGVQVLSDRAAAQWVLSRVKPEIAPSGAVLPVHVVACIPAGDIEVLRELLHCNGLPWPAHYHQICAESMAIGALRARGVDVPVPFSAGWLGDQLGVSQLMPLDKHTALGDARWTMALFDAASAPAAVSAQT